MAGMRDAIANQSLAEFVDNFYSAQSGKASASDDAKPPVEK
jgi:hypothetical protein